MQTQFLQNPQSLNNKSLTRTDNYDFVQKYSKNHNVNSNNQSKHFNLNIISKNNQYKNDFNFKLNESLNKVNSKNNLDEILNGKKSTQKFNINNPALTFKNTSATVNSDPLIPLSTNLSNTSNSKLSLVQQTSENILDSNKPNSVDYNLLKIQNFTLKSENNKIKQKNKKLDDQLKNKVQMLTKFNQLMKVKYNELKDLQKQLQNKDNQIHQLQEKLKLSEEKVDQKSYKIKTQLLKKIKQLDQLKQKINNLQFDGFKNQAYQVKINNIYEQLQEQKKKNMFAMLQKSELLTKIKYLDEKIGDLTYQNGKFTVFENIDKSEVNNAEKLFKNTNNSNTNSPSKSKNKAQHLEAFDEALKVQMKQISQLKQVIQNSQQMAQKLRDSLISSRKQLEQLRAEMKILDFKSQSQRKKMIMQYRLQLHEKDNQLDNFNKKYKTLQEKYKNSLNQIKNKDQFFRQHLIGRTNQINIQQYIQGILKKYTQNFDDIMNLKHQNECLKREIERYQSYQNQIENM